MSSTTDKIFGSAIALLMLMIAAYVPAVAIAALFGPAALDAVAAFGGLAIAGIFGTYCLGLLVWGAVAILRTVWGG